MASQTKMLKFSQMCMFNNKQIFFKTEKQIDRQLNNHELSRLY